MWEEEEEEGSPGGGGWRFRLDLQKQTESVMKREKQAPAPATVNGGKVRVVLSWWAWWLNGGEATGAGAEIARDGIVD